MLDKEGNITFKNSYLWNVNVFLGKCLPENTYQDPAGCADGLEAAAHAHFHQTSTGPRRLPAGGGSWRVGEPPEDSP